MNWSKGFSVSHYANIVDPVTWKDIERIEIISGTIKKSTDSLLQAADLSCEYKEELDLTNEQWIRVYADILQDDGVYHGPLFTGLICSPSKTINGSQVKNSLQCYSVLKPAEDVLLSRGWYVSAESDAEDIVKSLLSVTPAPVTIDGVSGKFKENLVAEENETNLSMVWKILDLMGWQLHISGRGEITITSYPTASEYAADFDSIENDSLETSVTIDYDWFNCPNVFRAVQEPGIAIARDDDENSPLSVPSRGREVWMEETNCVLKTNESLADYAKRRLKEEQNIAYTISYRRRYHPDVDVYDVVRLNYPAQNLIGYFRVTSQSISLGHSIAVSETANRLG